ncbi:MAG TPA: two-component regulator propeller domain-containing protein [Anaerolineaceae bacterium]|jgi:ligand-binding sensor domain-containing protein|nr:two-component regulator propeller domain-containing protein [Anaerolineaceae bacterium]
MNSTLKGLSPLFSIFLVVALVIGGAIWIESVRAGQARQEGYQIIRPPHEVHALAIQEDTLWAGGQDGVVGIRLGTGEVFTTLACDQSLDFTRALLVTPDGTLWIGHIDGLSQYTPTGCRTLTQSDGLPDSRVNALYLDRSGRLWVGTWGGAAVLTGNGWEVLTKADGLADDMVNVIYQDHLGGMWFGSAVSPRGGLTWCWQGQCRIYNTDSGLIHNQISAIMEDGNQNIWVGAGFFDRGGANRLVFQQTEWIIEQSLSRRDGLAGEKVRSIYEDQQHNIWFGSEYDGLARYDGRQFRILTTADGLADQEVKVILQDPAGNLWLGGRDGLTWIKPDALYLLEKDSR